MIMSRFLVGKIGAISVWYFLFEANMNESRDRCFGFGCDGQSHEELKSNNSGWQSGEGEESVDDDEKTAQVMQRHCRPGWWPDEGTVDNSQPIILTVKR
jgi:hypothetical protein